MNKLNLNQSVGFPFDTNILDFMQKAYTLFNALGAVSGDFSIIKGCVVSGSTVTDGVVYINGELLEFKGGALDTNVIIVENATALEFEDTETREVEFVRYATFGTATIQWPWSTFKRGMPTIDVETALAGKALNTDLTALAGTVTTMLTKLDTIATNAQVNVKPDWNAAAGSTQEILNKPAIGSPFLYKGSYAVGDVTSTDIIRTITFPNVGTAAYMVLGSLQGTGSDWNEDNDVFYTWGAPTASSFGLYLREIAERTQNLTFHFVIIAL